MYDPFCSIKIKITMFDRLGFMFVQRCVVVKDASVKKRHFSDNLIHTSRCSTNYVRDKLISKRISYIGLVIK